MEGDLGRPTEFEFDDKFPERAMLARIYRVDPIGDGSRGRISVEFDALDAAVALGEDRLPALFLSSETYPFGLIRVLTTPGRFQRLLDRKAQAGDWYRFQLTPREVAQASDPVRRLTAWHAQLTEQGYTDRSRGYISDVEFISSDDDPPLKALSSAVSPEYARYRMAIDGMQVADDMPDDASRIEQLLRRLPPISQIEVRDVGQASFATLYDEDEQPVLHYDAGWPTTFNGETAPQNPGLPARAPVIISHWDWDHVSGFYRFPHLQKVSWVAPRQKHGPGVARIIARLERDGLLHIFNGPLTLTPGVNLGLCQGPAGNRNQTGLALCVLLPAMTRSQAGAAARGALLTGDADYDRVPNGLVQWPLRGLLVTHHGADFEGAAPPTGGLTGVAIVSVGQGNRYKHPKPGALKRHKAKRWSIRMTMRWGGVGRGSKWIT